MHSRRSRSSGTGVSPVLEKWGKQIGLPGGLRAVRLQNMELAQFGSPADDHDGRSTAMTCGVAIEAGHSMQTEMNLDITPLV